MRYQRDAADQQRRERIKAQEHISHSRYPLKNTLYVHSCVQRIWKLFERFTYCELEHSLRFGGNVFGITTT